MDLGLLYIKIFGHNLVVATSADLELLFEEYGCSEFFDKLGFPNFLSVTKTWHNIFESLGLAESIFYGVRVVRNSWNLLGSINYQANLPSENGAL